MHICYIISEYPKSGFSHGGIGSFGKTIAAELVKNDVKVTVIGINYTNEYEHVQEDGVDIYRLKPQKVKGLTWLLNTRSIQNKIVEIHQKTPISIIEAQEAGLAFLKKIKGVKYVIRLHGGHHFFGESLNREIKKWKGFQEKRSFKKADAFVTISKFVKINTEKHLSFHHKKVVLLSNPINTELFKPISVNYNKNNIVFVGTVYEIKGIRQLIQAFGLVKKEFPAAVLNVYGRDWFFPNGKSYIQMLQETELPKLGDFAKDIHFHGAVSYLEIPSKYAEAAVCVFPSHVETQGLVAPEAMSMQKVVIFSNLGPGPETISNLETGLLCNPHDSSDIAQKICWVFAHKEKSVEIGLKAREFVLQKYDLKKIVIKNMEFYNTIIEE